MEYINDKVNTIIHKDNSLQRLNLAFQNHISNKDYKTANLLAYWINDFVKYHGEENEFYSRKLKVFKRGELVKANLGFNVGNELRGLHYCIVIEKYDNPKNGTLTVVPLTSKKSNKVYNQCTLNLGKEIYEILKNKIKKEIVELNKMIDFFSISTKFSEHLKNVLEDEIKKLKKDSIALINQITTISKQRLFDETILRKTCISDETLNLLDNKIIKTFTRCFGWLVIFLQLN